MSESSETRYAGYWKPFIYYVITMAFILLVGLTIHSELRDLQRRVGAIEESRK